MSRPTCEFWDTSSRNAGVIRYCRATDGLAEDVDGYRWCPAHTDCGNWTPEPSPVEPHVNGAAPASGALTGQSAVELPSLLPFTRPTAEDIQAAANDTLPEDDEIPFGPTCHGCGGFGGAYEGEAESTWVTCERCGGSGDAS